MKIFKDLLTGDEVLSDSYEITLVDDIVYEVKTKKITKNYSININTGSNPSTEKGEEEEEAGDNPQSELVIDVVDAHRLQEVSWPSDKSQFVAWMKAYSKAVLEKLTERKSPRADAFKKGMQAMAPKIIANLKEYQFFQGENATGDTSTLILLFFKPDDQMNAVLWYFKDGLEEEKC